MYDLTVDRGASATLFPNAEAFQLVVCRGLFWYVFPQMSQVVRNIASWVDSQGYLLIHQNFPPLDTNFVGKDIIPTPACPLEFFLETTCFTLICENHYLDYSRGKGNDNWSTFLLQKTGAGRG